MTKRSSIVRQHLQANAVIQQQLIGVAQATRELLQPGLEAVHKAADEELQDGHAFRHIRSDAIDETNALSAANGLILNEIDTLYAKISTAINSLAAIDPRMTPPLAMARVKTTAQNLRWTTEREAVLNKSPRLAIMLEDLPALDAALTVLESAGANAATMLETSPLAKRISQNTEIARL